MKVSYKVPDIPSDMDGLPREIQRALDGAIKRVPGKMKNRDCVVEVRFGLLLDKLAGCEDI